MKIDSCTEPQALAWQHFDRMRIRLIGQINRDLMRQTGLSEADFSILSELVHAENETVRALALRGGLEWEKSRLSHQIRRMEDRGLLLREPCAEDNRGSVIRLTETGAAVALDAIEQYAAIVRHHVFDRLTPAQIAALDDISATLLDALEGQEDADAEPAMHSD